MSLAVLADHMASKGRNGDTMLVHMAPEEVAGLHALALAHGGKLTVNPETGLVEAFSLKSLLPMIAGMALNAFLPGVGTAIGAALGGLSGAVGTGILVGGVTGLATGSLRQGIMAGLGAYGGASLGAGLSAAGSTPGAGLIDAANVNIPADAAARAAESGLSQEALRSQVSRQMAQEAFRNAGPLDQIVASAKGLTNEAGRQAFMTGVGGASGLAKAGVAALAPGMMPEPVATTTPRLPFGYTPYKRPMAFNQETQTFEPLAITPALEEPKTAKSGGIVALADGGTPPPLATREQVLAAYKANPLAELNPNDEAIKHWMTSGLGNFNQVVQDVRAANPMLAKQIDAARAVAQPNPLNLSTAGYNYSAEPVDASKAAIISGTAPAGYSYADAAITNPQAQQINQLYRNILNRDVEQEGLNYWMNQLKPKEAGGPGLSIPEIEAQIRQISRDIGVAAPTKAAPPTVTAVDTTYGGDTTTPTYTAPQPQVTLGEAFKPTAPTMSEVKTAYETGGGATKMPVITDVKPTDRTYTQNEAYGLLQGYLKANPNAQYKDVVAFASTRGIPEMQARAAYNEFRFSGLTGESSRAYDYLMGRGAYPVAQLTRPIMKPYAETVGLAPPGFYSGRKLQFDQTGNPKSTDSTSSSSDTSKVDTSGNVIWRQKSTGQTVKDTPSAYANDPDWEIVKPAKAGGLMDIASAAAARGGNVQQYNLGGYSDGGRLLRGPGDGVSDSIPATIGNRQPARLADGEFVIPARIVSEIGNGSTEAGARKLYAMMDRVQRARAKTTGKGRVAKDTKADKYLPA